MNSLPLSWSTNFNKEHFNLIEKKKICWISHASIQNENNLTETIAKINKDVNTDLIIRGCDNLIKEYLAKSGFYSLKIGIEAVLDTNHNCFKKKSLKNLVNRGLKKGWIEKIPYSKENSALLREFVSSSVHGKEPQLKNLFLTDFMIDQTLYVLRNNNEWLGAVLVSENSKNKLHTELILRTHNSPVGTMEAIIHQIYSDARKRNIQFLSLGEVPFAGPFNINKDGVTSTLISLLGRSLNFAYNYRGLKNFKAKFNPNWEPVYICTSNKIKFRYLIFMVIRSNFHKLVLFNLFYKLKNTSIFTFLLKRKKLPLTT